MKPAKSVGDKTVGETMTGDLVTLRLDDTLRLADDMMNLAHVRHFPVLDGDRLAGMVDHDDLLHASMASLVRHPTDALRQTLGEVTIKDIMKPAVTIAKEVSISRAAKIMVDQETECLAVTEGERLVGIVTRTDLLRELARGASREEDL
jgi:CBS domain-containing membrane protein